MDSSTIELLCFNCNKVIVKEAKKILKRLEKGQKHFFCSKACSNQHLQKYSFTKGNSFSKHDEYSIFRYHLRNVRKRCEDKKIEFDLTLEDLKALWENQNELCAVTKLKLTPKIYKDKKLDDPYQASLDRIDNSKGYTKDNIRWVCLIFNYARNTFSDEKVLDFISKASNNIKA